MKGNGWMWDENFLRFLTIHNRISNMEDSFLHPLYGKMDVPQVLSLTETFVQDGVRARFARGPHIYVHVPFCEQKCLYCHCTKELFISRRQLTNYLRYLARQVDTVAFLFRGIPMASLFLGGGTPSVLPEKELQAVFNLLRKKFAYMDSAQVSIEVNPSSVTPSKVTLLKKNGVNRVSIGIQSLDAKVMSANARHQTAEQAYRAVAMFQDAGVVLNVDLMAGLPMQTAASFVHSLRKVISWNPNSIQLNPFCDIDQSTYVRMHPEMSVLETIRLRTHMVSEAKAILSTCGFDHGEFGFFYRRGIQRVRHAQQEGLTMGADSVLGFGPYAHSRLAGYGAWQVQASQNALCEASYVGIRIELKFYMAEYLVKNLWRGIRLEKFQQLFGCKVEEVFAKEIDFLKEKNIINKDGGKLSYAGQRNIEGAFNYYTYTKVLYGKKVLAAFKKKYRSVYCPDGIYSWGREAFRRKMQDTVFTMTVSGLGF